MEKAVLKLAAHLLHEYASELSNNGCNDTTDEVLEMIKEIGNDNFRQMANEWNRGECEHADGYDWIVANAIAHKLQQMSESVGG
jgi:hypothetical protein